VTEYLLDTSILSETSRKAPAAGVVAWVRGLPRLLVPSVGVYELASGIGRLPAGKKRSFLDAWFAELLASASEVVPFDRVAALECAVLEADARRRHRTIDHRDLMILATARSRGLGVATRNVKHLAGAGVPLYDPFADEHHI
jgi:predicted nucleic acid-binding protein